MKLTYTNRIGLMFFIVGTIGFFAGNHDVYLIWMAFQLVGGIGFVQELI